MINKKNQEVLTESPAKQLIQTEWWFLHYRSFCVVWGLRIWVLGSY